MKKLLTLTVLFFTFVFAFGQREHKTLFDNGNLKEIGSYDEKGRRTGEWITTLIMGKFIM